MKPPKLFIDCYNGGTIVTLSTEGLAVTSSSSAENKRIDQLVKDLEDYEVLKPLGKGGMGLIYLVRHRLTNRTEVLKVLRPELAERKRLKDRFMREVQMAARLDHPNVVKTYTAIDRGFLGLVIEYVPGLDLDSMVKQYGPLRVENAASIIAQVARGLDYAVGRGLVHRDIKPSNILVSKSGQTLTAKLSDFGLCKDIEFDEADGLTIEGRFLGTPEYVAPEQALDPASSTVVSDIYGLGCTLYFALTGSPPYKGPNTIAVVNAHINSPIPDVRALRPDVPDQIRDLIVATLQKDARVRVQSPREVAETLEAFLSAPTVTRSLVQQTPEVEAPNQTTSSEAEPLLASSSISSGAATLPRRTRPAKAKKPKIAASSIAMLVMPLLLLGALLYLKPWQAPTGPGILKISDITRGVTVELDGVPIDLAGKNTIELPAEPGKHELRFLYGANFITAQRFELEPRGTYKLAATFIGLEQRFPKQETPPPPPPPPPPPEPIPYPIPEPIPDTPVTDEKPPAPKRPRSPALVESTDGWKLELMRQLTDVRAAERLVFIPRDVIQNRNELIVSFGDGVGAYSNALLAWDVKQGTQAKFDTPVLQTVGIEVAANQKSILYYNKSNCEVWAIQKQNFAKWFKSNLDYTSPRIFAISNDCKSLGCLDHNEQFAKWDLAQRKFEDSVSSQEPLGESKVSFVAMTGRLDYAIALSNEGELACWETKMGKVLGKISADILDLPIGLNVVPQTNQTNQVAVVTADGELKTWKLPTLEPQINNSVFESKAAVSCVSNRLMAVASTKGEVVVIDLLDAKIIGRLPSKPDSQVVGLAISPDNKTIAVGYESTIALYALRRTAVSNQKDQTQ